MPKLSSNGRVLLLLSACIIATFSAINDTRADEGGVSFWVPGLYGSLAATPQQPGWSLATIYYHAPVSAGDVNLTSKADLAFVIPTYVFATPVLGGQAAVSMMAVYGRDATSLASISDSVTGFGDLQPQFSLRWNAGVHNYMTYITGDIPVGAYDSTACPISASDMARSMSVRLHLSQSADRPRILRCARLHLQFHQPVDRNIAMASTCTSIGAPRNS